MAKKITVLGFCLVLLACGKTDVEQETMADEAARHKGNFSTVRFTKETDPICSMNLADGIADTAHYEGKIFGFCTAGCKDKFKQAPAFYGK
jgi:YHS domain-containing protein